MIIKATIYDNDFTEILEIYFKKFPLSVICDLYSQTTIEMMKEKISDEDMCNNLLNSDINGEFLTSDQEMFFINRIKKSLPVFIKNEFRDVDGLYDSIDYIINNLEITFPRFLEDKDENAECVYWLQHSSAVVIQ